jgi:hypothetical protein
MQRRLLLLAITFGAALGLSAQNFNVQVYRTYDGSFNNLQNPDWGQAHTNLRISGVGYNNLIDEPAGPDRPNPRRVSNSIFAQDSPLADPLALSDFTWVYGQFLDHDIGLTPDGSEPIEVAVPQGDPMFDPFNTGNMSIPMVRNVFDPSTGTTTSNPRRHPNEITAYIDGSGVYGSDELRANWLRTFEGGKLKVSAGNLPPFNTFNGEYDAPVDPNAPFFDNPVGATEKLFVCGDPRAIENPVLLAFHALFVREHNRLCDELATEHPDWSDEQLYQHARKLVGGLIQSITYDEWLPTMGIDLPDYEGYDPTVNAQLFNVFTAAAFRVGHTLLNGQLMRVDEDGNEIPEGHMLLRDAFFNPYPVMELGLEPFFRGMGVQMQQTFDSKVVDDVRNFLFGPPGSGGLDLVSINIQRGRERGLPDYNTIRANFGLNRLNFFQQVNSDPDVYIKLIGLYGDINDVDPWVGMLAEERMPNSLFGQTINRILTVQFTNLRDGDRFYYENDPGLSEDEKAWIKNTTMHDVLMLNTGIKLMQDEVFKAMPYDEICDNMTSDIFGNVLTPEGEAVSQVQVNVINEDGPMQLLTSPQGEFYFIDVPACDVNMVGMERDNDVPNGVSTADLIRLQQHILGVLPFDSPYQFIAGDVDRSGNISVLDMINIRKVVLGITDFFPNNFSWRFVDAKFDFQTDNPLTEDFPEIITVDDVLSQDMALEFIGVKVGDLTGDADPDPLTEDEPTVDNRSTLTFQLQNMELQAGQAYDIPVYAPQSEDMAGFQFGLNFNKQLLSYEGMKPGSLVDMTAENFGHFAEEGQLTTSYVKPAGSTIDNKQPLFYLTFKAQGTVELSRALSMSEQKLQAEAYDDQFNVSDINFAFQQTQAAAGEAFALYQNTPNPFRDETMIEFFMPETSWARLTVSDINGRILFTQESDFSAGRNQWQLTREQIPASGILYYTVETANDKATQRMIVIE